jgi:hypothetical protein
MAKVNSPLLSVKASGSVGTILTFSQRRTCQQVRYQRRQTDVISVDRTTQREKFKNAVKKWNELSSEEKTSWNTAALYEPMTGYDLYVRNYLLGLIADFEPSIYGTRFYGYFYYGTEV